MFLLKSMLFLFTLQQISKVQAKSHLNVKIKSEEETPGLYLAINSLYNPKTFGIRRLEVNWYGGPVHTL